MSKRFKYFSILIAVCFNSLLAQKTVTEDILFQTSGQNMWGNGAAFELDIDMPYYLQWDVDVGPYGGVSNFSFSEIDLGDWGASIGAGTSGKIGPRFFIKDVTGGSIDIDYPVRVNYIVPSDNSFDKGTWVTIQSNYALLPGYRLQTNFPNSGQTGLEFTFQFNANIDVKMCAYSCIEPGFDLSIDEKFYIFYLSKDSAIYPCQRKEWCDNFPQPCEPDGCTGKACIPSFCHKNLLPAVVDLPEQGISGFFDLPATSTSYYASGYNLGATGQYKYAGMGIDLLKFLSNFGGPQTKLVLGNMENEFSMGPIEFKYTLFKSEFLMDLYNKQRFSFKPVVYTTLDFPVPVNYRVKNPSSGTTVESGTKQSIKMPVGYNLEFKYPCNYDFIEVDPKYNQTNTFKNETYDSLSFDLTMKALAFELSMDEYKLYDGLYFPRECCCSGCLFGACWDEVCIGGYWIIPPITLPGFKFGDFDSPLFYQRLNLGSIKLPWYSNSWQMGGFNQPVGTTFKLIPREFTGSIISQTDILCFGDKTGAATVSVTNGTPPYTYTWSNQAIQTTLATTSSTNTLAAGSNYVVIEDANNCQVVVPFIISQPNEPLHFKQELAIDALCFGSSTGEINVSIDGGTPAYNYIWTPNVSSSETASNLSAGTYQLTVRDANNCEINNSYQINEPIQLSAVINTTNVNCNAGKDGTANVTVTGGIEPYSYLWSTGDTVQNNDSLPAGTHNLRISDKNICILDNPVVISEPTAAISIDTTVTHNDCFSNRIGEITLNVTGGTAGYSYQWFNSSMKQLSSQTNTATQLAADTFTAIVSDSKGCTESILVAIQQPLAPISSQITVDDILCFGSNTGNLDLSVSGGTIPYNILWSNSSNTEDLNNVPSGKYIVNITDANNCTVRDSAIINQPTDSISIKLFATAANCYGSKDGKIYAQISGGTPNFTYSWSNGETTSSIDSVYTGNYSLTITDANTCQSTASILVGQPSAPISITSIVSHVSCFDGSNGQINVSISGGTSPYLQKWYDSYNRILSGNSQTLTNCKKDDYTIIITDSNNCKYTETFSVSQPNAALKLTLSGNNISCFGGSDGNIYSQISGGTLPYTTTWEEGTTTANLLNTNAGIHTLTVVDNNNCSIADSLELTQPEAPLLIEVSGTPVTCHDGYNGTALAKISGGTYPYEILWNNGKTTEKIDSLSAAQYSIEVTDYNNCKANSGIYIPQPDTSVYLDVTIKHVSCFQYNDGKITVVPKGGTPPYYFSWGDKDIMLNKNGDQFENLVKGKYFLRVSDATNCVHEEFITITEPQDIVLNFSAIAPLCYGEGNGSISLSLTGGTPPYIYLWSNGTSLKDNIMIEAGDYEVSVRDANDCIMYGKIELHQPKPLVLSYEITEVSCRDNDDGSIKLSTAGGVGNHAYVWSNNEFTKDIFNLLPGEYIIEVEDENGCLAYDTIWVGAKDISCVPIPNIFSPNADGINDVWNLPNMDLYPDASVKVFNQWGKPVFESSGYPTAWNGSYNGKILPSATYYHIIDLNNGDAALTGSLTIVK